MTDSRADKISAPALALVDEVASRTDPRDPFARALRNLAAGIARQAERPGSPDEISAELVTETKAALALLAALDAGTVIIATKLAARRPHLN